MENVKNVRKKYWKIFLFSLFLLILFPFGVAVLVKIPSPDFLKVGDSNGWIGFFGNYSGGILGGIVAYIVARYQYENQKKSENETRVIQQLPSLVKLKLELEKVYIFLNGIKNANNTNPNPEIDLRLNAFKNPKEINQVFWDDLDNIMDVTIISEAIKLKEKYLEMHTWLEKNLGEMLKQLKDIEKKRNNLINKHRRNAMDDQKLEELNIDYIDLYSQIELCKTIKIQNWDEIGNMIIEINKLKEKVDNEISKIEKVRN